MQRFPIEVTDETVSIKTNDGTVPVGSKAAIIEGFGGNTVTVKYDDKAATYAQWLDLDDQNRMEIDVLETLNEMDVPEPFLERVAGRDHDGTNTSERTRFFCSSINRVWTNPGSLPDAENPFLPEG